MPTALHSTFYNLQRYIQMVFQLAIPSTYTLDIHLHCICVFVISIGDLLFLITQKEFLIARIILISHAFLTVDDERPSENGREYVHFPPSKLSGIDINHNNGKIRVA